MPGVEIILCNKSVMPTPLRMGAMNFIVVINHKHLMQPYKATISLKSCIFGTILLIITCSYHATAAEKQVQSTVLEQVTATHGPVTTFVSPVAVKLQFTDVNAYLVARAPTWRVMLVNVDSKLVYECPYEKWLSHGISRSYFGAEPDEQQSASVLTKGHNCKYADKMCELYFINMRLKSGRQSRIANYYLLSEPKPDSHACKVLEKWLAVPFSEGIPVAMKWYDETTGETYRAKQNKSLSSFHALYADNVDTKRVYNRNVNESFFSYPQSFKPVKTENEIFSTRETRHDAESIFSELENMKPPLDKTTKDSTTKSKTR